jgi:hypothetical protein
MFLGLLDPDPLFRGMDPDPDPSIIKQNSKKNLDSYCFVTFLLFILQRSGRETSTEYKTRLTPNPGKGF